MQRGLYEDFVSWSKKVPEAINKHNLKIITFEITKKCNLNCIHCGSPSEKYDLTKELTTNQVISTFKQISENFDLELIRFVNFTGGEPLIREDILEILKNINYLGFKRITFSTNGLKIAQNPNLVNELVKYNVTGIAIDIDGTKETHDKFRGRIGAFDESLKCAQILNNYKNKITLTISTVVSKININEIRSIWDQISKLAPHRWRILPIIPIGRASKNLMLNKDDYLDLYNFIREKRVNSKEIHVELGCGDWLGINIEGKLRSYIWHCIAGINTMGIYYDGKIGGCTNIDSTFSEGNVKYDNIYDVWNNKYTRFRDFSWKRNGNCIKCNQWDFCHGGPMHRIITGESKNFCLYKEFVESNGN